MHDGGVVATAELQSDLGGGEFGDVTGDEHGDLPGEGDGPGAFLALEIVLAEAEVLCRDPLDGIEGDVGRSREEFPELAGGDLQGNRAVDQIRVGAELGQGLFQIADVALDVLADQLDHVGRHGYAVLVDLLGQDGDARLVVRRLQVDVEAALEAVDEAVGEALQFRDRPVAGEHHLLVGVVERVEGMEQLLLSLGLPLQELHVIDQQHVGGAIAILETVAGLVLDRLDELVGECLDRDVDHLEVAVFLVDVIADGLQEVGLAQSDTAVDQAGVVGSARVLGDRDRGVEGKRVAVALDEAGEPVLRVELRVARAFHPDHGCRGRRWEALGFDRQWGHGPVGSPELEGHPQVLSGQLEQGFLELRSIPLVHLVPVE